MRYYQLTNYLGKTPLIVYQNVYLKMEMFNPSGSIKDRPAYFMLKRLIANGIIKKGDTIICPTSGNMGISLAYVGCLYQVNVIIVMPENMTKERMQIIKALKAQLILTDYKLGINGSIEEAKKLAETNNYYYFDQFGSPLNYISHFQTAQEILIDLPNPDYVVVGIGTGGTIIGIAKYLKKYLPKVKIIGVEPVNPGLVKSIKLGIDNKNEIIDYLPGIGGKIISKITYDNLSLIDEVKQVKSEGIIPLWHKLNNEGLRVGISSAAAYYVSQLILEEEPKAKIVSLMPDSYNRYLGDLLA